MTFNQTVESDAHARALRYLSLTVFVLMTFPRLRVAVGPAPLYAIDGLILLTAYYAAKVAPVPRSPLRVPVVFILLAMVASELIAGLRMGTLLEPVYLIGRTLLAGSLFFAASKVIRSKRDVEAIIKAGLLGAIISATLMILTSLPQTRGLVLRNVFSLSFLEPGGVVERYQLYQGVAARGRSLIGVSILSAAFLNAFWPMLFLLRTDKHVGMVWRTLLTVAAILTPVAVVMSYSRGAMVGLFLVIIAVILLNPEKVHRPVMAGVGLALLLFLWVGLDSDYFYFSRLELTIQNALAAPYENRAVTERLFAYVEPFQHARENPEFIFVGQGFARENVRGHDLRAGTDAATHAVFAAAYYGYGLLAAFAYLFLFAAGIKVTLGFIRRSKSGFPTSFSRALLAGLVGFLSWFMLGHAAVSQPRGAMLLFLIFGLVAAQSNFVRLQKPAQSRSRSLSLGVYLRTTASGYYPDDA